MTIALEHIQEGDWAAVNRVVDLLRTLVPDTAGRSVGIRWGTTALTFAASTNSGAVTITHGLGRTPVNAVATAMNAPAFGNIVLPNVANFGATTFQMSGELKTAFTGSLSVCWVVIG